MLQRDALILEYLPLARTIASRVHETLPVHVDFDDLVDAGILGLMDAATKYDAGKQVLFSTYARHRIRGAILDSLRKLDWASRDARRRRRQVEAATRELSVRLQRAPTEPEVAESLGMELGHFRSMMLDIRSVSFVSSSTPANDNENPPAFDFPSKPESQPDSICSRRELHSVLNDATRTLPERYQKVILMYYRDDMTMKEIGKVLNVNESRVSQMHTSALGRMRGAMQRKGVKSSQAF